MDVVEKALIGFYKIDKIAIFTVLLPRLPVTNVLTLILDWS